MKILVLVAALFLANGCSHARAKPEDCITAFNSDDPTKGSYVVKVLEVGKYSYLLIGTDGFKYISNFNADNTPEFVDCFDMFPSK